MPAFMSLLLTTVRVQVPGLTSPQWGARTGSQINPFFPPLSECLTTAADVELRQGAHTLQCLSGTRQLKLQAQLCKPVGHTSSVLVTTRGLMSAMPDNTNTEFLDYYVKSHWI